MRIPIRNSSTSIRPTFSPISLWPSNTRSPIGCFRPTRAPAFRLTSSSFPVLRLPQRPVRFSPRKIPSVNKPAGCIAPLTTLVTMIDAAGSETAQPPQYPCFEHPTLTDLLDTQGLTWRYYAPSPGSIWTGPDAIEHICQQQTINGVLTCKGPIWTANVIIPQTQVLTDIANGQLAQVSWVIPNGMSSDHALANDGSGPAWVASIVNAIGNSAYWANTAIIITWDDWGGGTIMSPPRSSTTASAGGRDMSTVFACRLSSFHPTPRPLTFPTSRTTSAAS